MRGVIARTAGERIKVRLFLPMGHDIINSIGNGLCWYVRHGGILVANPLAANPIHGMFGA